MKNKIIIGGITLLALFFLQVGISHAHGPYVRRHHFQMERIDKGVCYGEVTGREYRYLENEQRRIESFRRHSLADGRLSRGERQNLYRLQNRAAGDIYRAKHNQRYCGCSNNSRHVVRSYSGQGRSCSDHRRYGVADDRPSWGFSGFFFDRR